jgi:ParB/RepB/Spo0J family partition protein
MRIVLEAIKPSPHPIRKTWDEDKLRDLCWSLLEEGQVEPIGVFEDAGGYIVVWGHRRVEAARRAGWIEIDAMIVQKDEINNLIQSGIENLSGEEMTADDKAEWAHRLVDMGFSQHEIARRTSIPAATINQWLQYKREKEAGVYVHVQNQPSDEGIIKTVRIAQALGDDLEGKRSVAAKVSAEGLTQILTTEVARAYHDAPNAQVKQKIIESPVLSNDKAADIVRRSVARVELDNIRAKAAQKEGEKIAETPGYSRQDFGVAVKDFLDALQPFYLTANQLVTIVKHGRYSKATLRYAIVKMDEIINDLISFKELLESID